MKIEQIKIGRFFLFSLTVSKKTELKMRLIFAFFGEFVRYFENSKNQKVQTLGGAFFGDTSMH